MLLQQAYYVHVLQRSMVIITSTGMAILNSCSRIPLLQLMRCLKSVRLQFQLFCRSLSACHRQLPPAFRNFVTSWCTVVLFGISLSGYALLNASRTAADNFDVK
jgi:hypothetical protein